ncbi:TPA: pentapeptide repeat-containing protein [Vibrio parahaemolyticus]|nr:pentapeptide repeat-containing protein [Vibrio parahaemolyticus]
MKPKKREYQANSKLDSRDLLKLDFNEVLVDGKTINEYFYSNVKHASKHFGWVDLSGIPLRDTRISNAVICNAQLSNADFSNSVLQSITFVNCNLASCNFENSHVTMLRFKGAGGLANSNWISASVNSIDISANQFGAFPVFAKIGYFQLINVALTGRVPRGVKYTDFSNCYLKVESEEDSTQVKLVKEYISWYQNTINRYTYRSRNDSLLSKIMRVVNNTFNAITTMNWSSLWSTVLTGCSLVILFSALFFL